MVVGHTDHVLPIVEQIAILLTARSTVKLLMERGSMINIVLLRSQLRLVTPVLQAVVDIQVLLRATMGEIVCLLCHLLLLREEASLVLLHFITESHLVLQD
jgi:hypothetical protein